MFSLNNIRVEDVVLNLIISVRTFVIDKEALKSSLVMWTTFATSVEKTIIPQVAADINSSLGAMSVAFLAINLDDA